MLNLAIYKAKTKDYLITNYAPEYLSSAVVHCIELLLEIDTNTKDSFRFFPPQLRVDASSRQTIELFS